MNVKSLKKQLVAAIAMVVVAAVALSSSTFAWFAANNEVEATGLNVTAQSDAPNLVISNTSGGTFGTSQPADESGALLYPAAHETFTQATDVTTVAKWYYGYSNDKADSTMVVSTKRTVDDADFNKYVASYTFFVKLDSATAADMKELKVSDVTFTGQAVNAIFVGPDGYEEVIAGNPPTGTVLASTVTGVTEVPVTVYLYVDGNNTNTTTNNIANLKDTISFKLTANQQ